MKPRDIYKSESIPSTIAESNNYNLRNRHNISQPANRLSSYQNSFFLSTIRTWNTLDLNIREVSTCFTLKKGSNLNILEIRKYHISIRQVTDT
jgi:hypothetical protein